MVEEKQNENENDSPEDQENYDEYEDEEVEEEDSRDLVVPGEVLTDNIKDFTPGRGTILNKKTKQIISLHIGLKQIKKNYINVIPLRGLYTPQPGDKIIAVVTDKNPVKYKCDINAKDFGQLKPKNTMKMGRDNRRGPPRGGHRSGGRGDYHQTDQSTERFKIGDVLIVKVISADRLNKPELTTVGKYLGKKMGGIVVTIDPPKIPRIIGRNGSMIKMLKNLTGCNIFVTQNGRIWIRGDNIKKERLLIDAINKINREAHTTGLTDRIEAFLKEKINGGN